MIEAEAARELPAWMRALAVLAVCAPLLAPLGTPGLINPDEGRFAEIAREMIATGDWVVPRLNGIPHWSKPPLSYWAIAVSFKAFGLTERAARLPSAIAATAALLATWFLARRMGGAKVATVAVVALATMFLFYALARIITSDMIQTALIAWAAALLWEGRSATGPQGCSPAVRYGAFLCLGISFVDKGPVALAVFLASLLVFRLLRPGVALLTPKQLALGIVLVLVVGLPWFLVVSRLHPDLVEFYLGREVKDRYLTELHGRAQAPWFLPVVLLAGTLPWTLVLLASIGSAIARLRRAGGARGEDDAGRYLFSWIAGPFLFFSFSGSKLATYLLPLMPFCAIAVARWIAAAQERPHAERPAVVLGILAATPAVMAVAFAAVAVGVFEAPVIGWAAAAAIVTAASTVIFLRLRSKASPLRPIAAAGLVGLVVLAWEWSVPILADEDSMDLRSHASQRWIRNVVSPEEVRGLPIGSDVRPAIDQPAADPPANIVIYRLKVNSLPFYLLDTRPESVPVFGYPAGWEIQSDQSRAHVPSLADLATLLSGNDRVRVLTRRSYVPEIEAALGRSLAVAAAHGRGEYAVVLASNR